MATEAPTLYLGLAPNSRCRAVLGEGLRAVDPEDVPSVLIAFPYLHRFREDWTQLRIRTWCLDSGAFSAWNSGAAISLDDYTRTFAELLASDPRLAEVFALDVIGDWRASDLERMKGAQSSPLLASRMKASSVTTRTCSA
jgi:hypothetical protein